MWYEIVRSDTHNSGFFPFAGAPTEIYWNCPKSVWIWIWSTIMFATNSPMRPYWPWPLLRSMTICLCWWLPLAVCINWNLRIQIVYTKPTMKHNRFPYSMRWRRALRVNVIHLHHCFMSLDRRPHRVNAVHSIRFDSSSSFDQKMILRTQLSCLFSFQIIQCHTQPLVHWTRSARKHISLLHTRIVCFCSQWIVSVDKRQWSSWRRATSCREFSPI